MLRTWWASRSIPGENRESAVGLRRLGAALSRCVEVGAVLELALRGSGARGPAALCYPSGGKIASRRLES